MTVPGNISTEEPLGRRVFSNTSAKRARRSKVPHREFLITKPGETFISVDRLGMAPLDEVAALAQEASVSRDRQFYGWASVAAREAGGNGRRRVIASPQDGNPYHADIVLPDSAATDRGERIRHAQELADASCWIESPKSAGASGAEHASATAGEIP
jgi:hypothetical protein